MDGRAGSRLKFSALHESDRGSSVWSVAGAHHHRQVKTEYGTPQPRPALEARELNSRMQPGGAGVSRFEGSPRSSSYPLFELDVEPVDPQMPQASFRVTNLDILYSE